VVENVPGVSWYEKAMLRHLQKHPNDYAGALRKIPKRILRIYTSAYQSLSFNEQLNKLLAEGNVPKTMTIQGFQNPEDA